MNSSKFACVGIDIGKSVFHVVGLDMHGAVGLRGKYSRAALVPALMSARVRSCFATSNGHEPIQSASMFRPQLRGRGHPYWLAVGCCAQAARNGASRLEQASDILFHAKGQAARRYFPRDATRMRRECGTHSSWRRRLAARLNSDAGGLPAMWEPITPTELEHVIEQELRSCTPAQRAAFAAGRVPFYAIPIHRLGAMESVLVVAHLSQGLLYFQDVEEGFEFGTPGEDGAIPNQGCNQYSLRHVLSQAGF